MIYFRDPTGEEKTQSGIDKPFTVIDKEKTEKATNDQVKDSDYYFEKIMGGKFI